MTMPLTITGRVWYRDKECQAHFVVVKGSVGCRKRVSGWSICILIPPEDKLRPLSTIKKQIELVIVE